LGVRHKGVKKKKMEFKNMSLKRRKHGANPWRGDGREEEKSSFGIAFLSKKKIRG
jgi:hypothetical protein